jgi:hypothetical protein
LVCAPLACAQVFVSITKSQFRIQNWLAALLLALLVGGCATRPLSLTGRAQFDFQKDTFAYANELKWVYHIDPATGKQTSTQREPPPTYWLHCFVVARSARQFFQHAKFDPAQPRVDEAGYRKLIEQVVQRNPRRKYREQVVVPGFADLRSFSEANENLLKANCGAAWQSYCQRGHWRMIMPFSRSHQERMAAQFKAALAANKPPVVHIVCFPQLTINHAVVLFDVSELPNEVVFSAYDPNTPAKPSVLRFDKASRTFNFPANDYFAGGRVNAYEIYLNCLY